MWKFNQYFDKLAAIDENGKITYARLDAEGNRLAKQLGERCLVFCLCSNSIASLVGYTGLLNNGSVPLLLDRNLDMELLRALILTYKPMYLWCPEEMIEAFCGETVHSFEGYVLFRLSKSTPKMSLELGLLLTTSGSTGSPKLVRQSYSNILSNAQSIVEYLELNASERPVTNLPMSYTYGLSVINSHLLTGATMLMTDKSLLQREFWDFFKRHNATSIAGVPYTYEILKKLHFFKMSLPSLRYMTQAGGKLAPELHKEFAEYALRKNVRFYVMYGQTEATARMAYLPYQKSLEKYGSMGIAIPGGSFQLIDDNGNEIENSGVVGELVYTGDNVTLGYAECVDDLKKEDENQGVLKTGDMAMRDIDGYYYIIGRKKRFLKIFGNRINLDETERLIKKEFDVACACAGVDDKMTIFIDGDVEVSRVIHFICEKTGLNHIAFSVRNINEIPKSEAGKILYSKLAEGI